MKKGVYFLLAMVLLTSIIFSACSQSTTTPPAPATTQGPSAAPATQGAVKPTTSPRYGGVYKLIHNLSVVNLGYVPDAAEPYDTWVAETDLENLLTINPDGSYGPLLAADYKVASDYKSVVFNLRKGVKFHDGTDFNAQAVKYNLDLYNKGKLDNLRFVSSVDVVDDYTVKVNFSTVQAGFLLPFATRPGEMESPKALAENPKEWFLTHTVGTGPFQFDNYVRDMKISYKKFPGYWQQGKPYLDGIEWMTIADKTTSLMSYRSGEANALLYPNEKDRPDLQKAGINVEKIFGPIFTLLMDSGNADSPFGNLKVRQAVAYSIDIAAMAQGLGYGYWEVVNQFAYPSHWGYNKDVVGYSYNPAKAKQLLAEAGYPNGFKTTLYASSAGYFELVQSYLKEVGIEAEIVVGTIASGAERRQKGWNNGISISPGGGPTGPYKDSRVGMALFSKNSGSYPNILHNDEIENLITQSDKELDSDKRMEIYRQLNKVMIDKYLVALPLWRNPGAIAISADTGYWNFQDATGARFAPQDAWLKK